MGDLLPIQIKMAHDFKRFPELTNNQMGMYYFDSPHQQIAEDFWATVVRVKDGDTIQVKADFRDFTFPVRFSNILAAELNEKGGRESQSWLEGQILGEEVEIVINKNNRVGKWGRILGQVKHQGFDMGELSIQNNKSTNLVEEKDPIPQLIIDLIL